jgi:hypothetical protein
MWSTGLHHLVQETETKHLSEFYLRLDPIGVVFWRLIGCMVTVLSKLIRSTDSWVCRAVPQF